METSVLARKAPEYLNNDFFNKLPITSIGYASLLLFIIPLAQLLLSSNGSKEDANPPPNAKCTIPFLEHTIALASGGQKLFSLFSQYCGLESPIRFRLIGQDLVLLSSTSIRKTIHNPHIFIDGKLRARFIANVFKVPQPAADVVGADNSGSGQRPTPGSNVPPSRRIVRMQQETAFDFLQSKDGINTFATRFMKFLEVGIAPLDINDEWKSFPDFPSLYSQYILHGCRECHLRANITSKLP